MGERLGIGSGAIVEGGRKSMGKRRKRGVRTIARAAHHGAAHGQCERTESKAYPSSGCTGTTTTSGETRHEYRSFVAKVGGS